MPVLPVDWETVTSVCEEASARAVGLIRSANDPDQAVPGLTWTVHDLAAHLVSMTTRYRPFLQGVPTPALESMAALNASEIEPFAGRSLAELADELEHGIASLLALCPSGDGPALIYGMETDCTAAIGLVVDELVVHGIDLARAVDERWSVTRAEAMVALAGLTQVLPLFVNPEAVHGAPVVFEIRLRGGPSLHVTFHDGAAGVAPGRIADADCRFSADPVAFLLVATGRQSQWRALAGGKLLAWGRRPWLGLRMTSYVDAA